MTDQINFDWSTVPVNKDSLVYDTGHALIIPPSMKTIIYGEGGRMLAEIDNMGNVTYAKDLTLEDAKFALKCALEALMKEGMK